MKKVIIYVVIIGFVLCGLFGVVYYVVNRPEKEYTITFNPDNGKEKYETIVKENDQIEYPETPIKEGYGFEGWFVNNDKWNFASYVVRSDLELTARWSKKLVINDYYVYDFLTLPLVKNVIVGSDLDISDPIATGKEFLGYKINNDIDNISSVPSVMPDSDLTLDVIWNTVSSRLKFIVPNNKEYIIEGNVGDVIDKEEINKKIIDRLGYTFTGFDKEIPDTIPPYNMTFTANYIPDVKYKIVNDKVRFTGVNKEEVVILSKYEGVSVTSIDNQTFMNCTSLTSLTLADGFKTIGSEAFENCKNLQNVFLPDTLTSIKYGAFKNCESLTSIKLPEQLVEIGESVFDNCINLKSVEFNENLSVIGSYAFTMTALQDVDMGKTQLITLVSNTFSNCSMLTNIVLPKQLKILGNNCFMDCPKLKSFKSPNLLYEIGYEAFRNCTALSELDFSGNINSIAFKAFYNCTSIQEVKFGIGLTTLGDEAFGGCTSLETVYIPEGLGVGIGKSPFNGCSSLKLVNYAGTVKQWNSIPKLSNFQTNNSIYNISIYSEKDKKYIYKDGKIVW